MRQNHLRTLFAEGRAALNGWVHTPSSFTAEVLAHAGFDSITIDMQHGLADYSAAVPMIQAINTTNAVPIARVPWNEPGIIGRMLDAGCYGIICPLVNSRADCEAFVDACRYPPAGGRSHGPTRVSLWAGSDYAANANATVLTFAMVESAAALADLEAIVNTPGLDGIYIGPADLGQSLGHPPRLDPTIPAVTDAIAHIVRATRQAGRIAGIHTASPAYASQMITLGCQFVSIGSDANLLAAAASSAIASVRDATGGNAGTPTQNTY